jgi:hypothetical protein
VSGTCWLCQAPLHSMHNLCTSHAGFVSTLACSHAAVRKPACAVHCRSAHAPTMRSCILRSRAPSRQNTAMPAGGCWCCCHQPPTTTALTHAHCVLTLSKYVDRTANFETVCITKTKQNARRAPPPANAHKADARPSVRVQRARLGHSSPRRSRGQAAGPPDANEHRVSSELTAHDEREDQSKLRRREEASRLCQ